jgi:hypothetical protein
MQQRGRLQRALTTSDYEHSLSGKGSEVPMLTSVRCEQVRKICKLWRSPSERTDTRSDNNTACEERLTGVERELKAPAVPFDLKNLPSV